MTLIVTHGGPPPQGASLRERAAAAYQSRVAAARRAETRLLLTSVEQVLAETVAPDEVFWRPLATGTSAPVVQVGGEYFTARWNPKWERADLFYLRSCPGCEIVSEVRIDHLADLGEVLAADARCARCVELARQAEEERG